MKPFKYASETLHIALVSLSQGQARNHIASLLKGYYHNYKKGIEYYSKNQTQKLDSYLYQPLEYFIFGNYDIALISVINNYKFSQKQPSVINNHKLYNKKSPNSKFTKNEQTTESNLFQVITGSCPLINQDFSVANFFKQKQKSAEAFICITNLKLNNKLLIGNGNFFLELVFKIIDKRIKKVFKVKPTEITNKYFLQQTYSWCEITIVFFSNVVSELTEVVTELRRLTLNDLFSSIKDPKKFEILRNSLYAEVLKENKLQFEQINPDLFADSHSYFGVHTKSFDDKKMKTILSQELKTQIEWQVKPGHFEDLLHELQQKGFKINKKKIFSDKVYFLTGKTDFFIPENTNSFLNNQRVIEELKLNPKIFQFARKVKSKVLLEYEIKKTSPDIFHPSFREVVKSKFLNDIPDIAEINTALKELKVSRNIRSKISKIYFNYQNGIQDPILFTYFLDFKIFINNLTNLILEEVSAFRKCFDQVNLSDDYFEMGTDKIENLLIKMIEIFEEGYNIRMLNCNQYEDINDFDLDFNSSVQQILSMYGTLAIKLGNIFFEKNVYGPVVQLNLKNTISNIHSINYDVYHLTCPEFVLYTLIKEVLNKYIYSNEKESHEAKSIKEVIDLLKSDFLDCTNYDDEEVIDFNYYFIDAVRFIHTFNFDFELFEYWFWTYTFQKASLYDKTGTFNERYFRIELLRLYFLAKLFSVSFDKITCPLPEIYYLWERHAKSSIQVINNFFETKSPSISTFKIKTLSVFHYDESFKLPPMTSKLRSARKKIWESILANLNDADRIDQLTKGEFQLINISLQVLSLKNSIIEKINAGLPFYCNNSESNGYIFFNSFIYAYLTLIRSKNKRVRLLGRNWENGKPLRSFIFDSRQEQDDFLYAVDQFGGIFFYNNNKSEEYFKIRNAMQQSLWHFSLLIKKKIYY